MGKLENHFIKTCISHKVTNLFVSEQVRQEKSTHYNVIEALEDISALWNLSRLKLVEIDNKVTYVNISISLSQGIRIKLKSLKSEIFYLNDF